MSISVTSKAAQDALAKIREYQQEQNQSLKISEPSGAKSGAKFLDVLKQSIHDVNSMQITADKAASEIAAGKSESIHETMLSTSQAELSFNLMVQVRNRALEAYQEVMKMPV